MSAAVNFGSFNMDLLYSVISHCGNILKVNWKIINYPGNQIIMTMSECISA